MMHIVIKIEGVKISSLTLKFVYDFLFCRLHIHSPRPLSPIILVNAHVPTFNYAQLHRSPTSFSYVLYNPRLLKGQDCRMLPVESDDLVTIYDPVYGTTRLAAWRL
jgi:hypothetical protein